MEFRCLTASLADPGTLLEVWQGDTLAVGLFSDPDHPARAQVESLVGAGLSELLERRRFKGKPGESVSLQRLEARPGTVILVGLGEPAGFDGHALRTATASIARAAAAAGSRSLALALPVEGLESGAATAAMAAGIPSCSSRGGCRALRDRHGRLPRPPPHRRPRYTRPSLSALTRCLPPAR
jgi:leucyl aminopeptidase